MRHERVDQLIEAIKNGLPEVKFDMMAWIKQNPDGTCNGCIAAHASILAIGLEATKQANRNCEVFRIANDWLGISVDTGTILFTPPELHNCQNRNWAVRQLKRLKELA